MHAHVCSCALLQVYVYAYACMHVWMHVYTNGWKDAFMYGYPYMCVRACNAMHACING